MWTASWLLQLKFDCSCKVWEESECLLIKESFLATVAASLVSAAYHFAPPNPLPSTSASPGLDYCRLARLTVWLGTCTQYCLGADKEINIYCGNGQCQSGCWETPYIVALSKWAGLFSLGGNWEERMFDTNLKKIKDKKCVSKNVGPRDWFSFFGTGPTIFCCKIPRILGKR